MLRPADVRSLRFRSGVRPLPQPVPDIVRTAADVPAQARPSRERPGPDHRPQAIPPVGLARGSATAAAGSPGRFPSAPRVYPAAAAGDALSLAPLDPGAFFARRPRGCSARASIPIHPTSKEFIMKCLCTLGSLCVLIVGGVSAAGAASITPPGTCPAQVACCTVDPCCSATSCADCCGENCETCCGDPCAPCVGPANSGCQPAAACEPPAGCCGT